MQARQRAFPLQQPTYTAPELHAHMAADHPQCCFCGPRFLDAEQYGLHMMGAHPYCELCDDDFRDAAEFTEHLRSVPAILLKAILDTFCVHGHLHARAQGSSPQLIYSSVVLFRKLHPSPKRK